jgi:hypothetical protein
MIVEDRFYTKSELAAKYGLSCRTFMQELYTYNTISKLLKQHGKNKKTLPPRIVKVIVSHLEGG